jgi:hypothetical protein
MKKEKRTLGIKCGDTRCEQDLHCFREKKRGGKGFDKGLCNECGADLVDWDRIKRRKLSDIDHTFEALRTELIRHAYWNVVINEKATAHARKRGKIQMLQLIRNQLKRLIGNAQPFNDGRQTSTDLDSSSAIPFGQHATGTCCRRCLEYWHGIERGRELTPDELDYCAALVLRYIQMRIPDITENGE